MKLTIAAAAFLAQAIASPVAPRETNDVFTHEVNWSAKVARKPAFPIHESCNATLSHQLSLALDETVVLARHAKEHILRWGGESPLVQRYFGNGTTAMAVGWYETVVAGDRGAMMFRCDDPDENCATQEGKSWFPPRSLQTICRERYSIIRPWLPVCFRALTPSPPLPPVLLSTLLSFPLCHFPHDHLTNLNIPANLDPRLGRSLARRKRNRGDGNLRRLLLPPPLALLRLR